MNQDTTEIGNIFEERAELLSKQELADWTQYTHHDDQLISKLIGPGAKLLTGPRGSGKSTLLRTAYFKMVDRNDVLPAYINYAKSLALEPLFHRRSDALKIFRSWVINKIILGIYEGISDQKLVPPQSLAQLHTSGKLFVSLLASGNMNDIEIPQISPTTLTELIEQWCKDLGKNRCILLMDDAAHAFSPEQQREFFEIFRELRTRIISCKAAVYPGITSYSPYFHVGHEAELLQAWYKPDDEGYLDAMVEMLRRRLPARLMQLFSDRMEVLNLMSLASFGLPRGFLNMVSQSLGVDEGGSTKPTKTRVERAISDHADSIKGIFSGLQAKLPRFRHFVDVGNKLQLSIMDSLKRYNHLRNETREKSTVIAIEEPIGPQIERMMNMLEYAGVVRKLSGVSKGEKGVFQRFSIHYASIIVENGLSLGKNFSSAQMVEALSANKSHSFVRTKGSKLLSAKDFESCILDLPPCSKCNSQRFSEDQRFCMKCGTELANASVYEELLSRPIDYLPLPGRKINDIKRKTSIRSVQDILLDDDQQRLRTIPYVGPFWSNRIRTVAEEFVSV